jgi:hypothetical protein
MTIRHSDLPRAGWREWLALPELGIAAIKAKLDTGARTSALHAFSVERFEDRGIAKVRLGIHSRRGAKGKAHWCEAEVIDERWVTNSGGLKEKRLVIRTLVMLGPLGWPVEISIADRDTLRFRMLLGRSAMQGRLLVDPAASYLLGKRKKKPAPASR